MLRFLLGLRLRSTAPWFRTIGLLCWLALVVPVWPGAGAASEAPRRPKLVVLMVVDQMRPDYLLRFAALYTGGLARLNERGAIFAEAHHRHGYTVTAVGHASIATGTDPNQHGIVGNDWYDRARRREIYVTEDESVRIAEAPELTGQSPKNLMRSTLADWLKASSPKSKVVSVAFKDRSSILLGGRRPDGAYWYDSIGRFVTSTWYGESLPKWVRDFNASDPLARYFDGGWARLLADEAYLFSREDDFAAENDNLGRTFPHRLPTGSPEARQASYQAIWYTPFGDEVTLDFARAAVENEALGADDAPDLLCVGLSTADAVGHWFGPLSQEVEDYYLRLDRSLGAFLNFLDARVGADNYVLALTSDHGVLPMPEELHRRGYDSKRIPAEDLRRAIGEAVRGARGELGLEQNVVAESSAGGIYLDYAEADARKIPRARVARVVAEHLRRLPFLADALTLDELTGEAGEGREFLDAYRRAAHPERSPDIFVRPVIYYLLNSASTGTSHGSPYRYDTHVPIVFLGPKIAPGTHTRTVATVDIAPTLARMLGLTPPSDLAGSNLLEEITVFRPGS